MWGPWANMCCDCHARCGEGVGTGKGQLYEKQTDGRWLKITSETEHAVDRAEATVERSWQAIEAAEVERLADQLRAGPVVVEIWDYTITHDGELDNPIQ